MFKFALSQNKEQPYYHSSIAEAYEMQGKYFLAMQHYQDILTRNPSSQYAKAGINKAKQHL